MRAHALLIAALACARPQPRERLPDEELLEKAELARAPSAEVRALLDSKDAAVRTRAEIAAGRIADAAAVPKLAALARDDDAAAWALGRMREGRDALVACLPRPSCARALGGNVEAIEALIDALPEPEAAFALGVTARNKDAKFPPRTWAALTAALPRIPAGAAYALSRMPKGASPLHELEVALRSDDPWTRSLAARAWGVQGLPAYGLARAFEDPDWRVRVEAARGLPKAPGAAETFVKVLPKQTNPHVLTALYEAAPQIGPDVLDALPKTPCGAAIARDRIRKKLVDAPACAPQTDWRQRARVGALAAELGAPEAVAAMHDPDGRVRGAAAGAAAPALFPEVQKLLADPDPYVIQEAAGVLAGDTASREAALEAARRLEKAREKPAGDPEYDALAALTPLTGAMLPKRPFTVPREALAMPDARTLRLRTSKGEMVIDLKPDVAPLTSSALAALAKKDFFSSLTFHRVVPDFVIQGGDPRGDGDGGPGWVLPDEHSPLRFQRGTVGIATNGPETGGSQFFICHSPQPHLDGKYTIVGQLRTGDDVLDAIEPGDTILEANAE